jgi:hypothetical protein
MVKAFGYVFIDLNSAKHAEVWLHVFPRRCAYEEEKEWIVVEEGGVGDTRPVMHTMTREEFRGRYDIDIPEGLE